ncbi:hypothetical protein OHB12_05330 [Nocardia sp. NBC_01730]|uniref:hypothetical protein n=1 Tax=Nocardia sp. NBC_01730 TaxID=2975998 RepID=UPI002E0E544B|nr:hypothetical protein OHB12_05330 [Nocardia sp. NBC_01730]
MVQLLQHIYPFEGWQLRGTTDAAAGMEKQALIASAEHLHQNLLSLGYELEKSNRYTMTTAKGLLDVDILVPSYDNARQTSEVAGRAFDAVPGLHFTVVTDAVIAHTTATLAAGETIGFTVPIPDIEAAVVLKALAWHSRTDKDVTDLATLFEIVHQHCAQIQRWKLADPNLSGARNDAVVALRLLIANIDRGRWSRAFTGSATPSRFSALIRRYASGQAQQTKRPYHRGVILRCTKNPHDRPHPMGSPRRETTARHIRRHRDTRTRPRHDGRPASTQVHERPGPHRPTHHR